MRLIGYKVLGLIMIYYIFKYSFGIKTNSLEPLQSQKKKKNPLKLDFVNINFNDFVSARSDSFKAYCRSKSIVMR